MAVSAYGIAFTRRFVVLCVADGTSRPIIRALHPATFDRGFAFAHPRTSAFQLRRKEDGPYYRIGHVT